MFYFHADRANRLESGMIIAKEPYSIMKNESFISTLCPYFKDDFLQHLIAMQKENGQGLGLHAVQYIVQPKNLSVTQFLLELFFEYVRFLRYSNKPSRFQSLFATEDKATALKFMKQTNSDGQIFTVEGSGLFFKGDMNWLNNSEMEPSMQMYRADSYWQGLKCSEDKSYIPFWEVLLELPVKILDKVDI